MTQWTNKDGHVDHGMDGGMVWRNGVGHGGVKGEGREESLSLLSQTVTDGQ